MKLVDFNEVRKKKPIGCSVCKKTVVEEYKPFCSKRCADVDLNRWFTESYTMPTEEPAIANDPYGDDDNY